jgi:hypothetical protein
MSYIPFISLNVIRFSLQLDESDAACTFTNVHVGKLKILLALNSETSLNKVKSPLINLSAFHAKDKINTCTTS